MKTLYILIVFALFSRIYAAEYYATVSGAGAMDGSSWENAARGATLSSFINSTLNAGDRLTIGSGTYSAKIEIKVSGEADRPVIIQGEDTGDGLPVLTGKWSTNDPGSSNGSWAAVAFDGQSHLVIKKLVCTQWMYGVNSGKNASYDIELDSLFLFHNREGIYLNHVHDSRIKNCVIEMYSKRGIRFDGDVNGVEVNTVLTDHNKGDVEWLQEWPFGFMVEEKPNNHSITFINCVSLNNRQENGSDYWNGDGFCAEKTAYNLKYFNCESYNNADGGWDDKSRAPYLENCIAFGNKRNFRFWNVNGSESQPAWMKNCIGAYAASPGGSGSQCGVWTQGFVKIENSTFHNNKSHAISAETDGSTYSVIVLKSILSATDYLGSYSASQLTKTESGATISLTECEKFVTDKTGTDPNFNGDDPAWQGAPDDAFNSQTFGPAIGFWMGETHVGESVVGPAGIRLEQNYPNPFNPTTTISYVLNKKSNVTLHVFDVRGRLISTLVKGRQPEGIHAVQFDAHNLPSGVYFYQLGAEDVTTTRSMLLMR